LVDIGSTQLIELLLCEDVLQALMISIDSCMVPHIINVSKFSTQKLKKWVG